VKRGVPEPLIDDIILCSEMSWTYQQLMSQPAKFIEILKIYLNISEDIRQREKRRIEEQLERLGKT